MTVVVFAGVTFGIVVHIVVRAFFRSGYIVIASGLVPMLVFVVRPIEIVLVLVIVVPFTNRNVTNTVVICVYVRTNELSGTSVTNEVRVYVFVIRTFEFSFTDVASEIFVLVYVIYAFDFGFTDIALKILIVIYVNGAYGRLSACHTRPEREGGNDYDKKA